MAIHENVEMGQKLRSNLASNLRARMGQLELVQTDIEDLVGIGQSSVSRILNAQTGVTLDLLEDLARAVKLQPWELLVDSEEVRERAIRKMLGGKEGDVA